MTVFQKISDGVYRILKYEGIAQALGDWTSPSHSNLTTHFQYINGVPRTFPVTLKFERQTDHLPKVVISIINKHQAIQMEENTTEVETKTTYSVSGNLDQIQKHGLDIAYTWVRVYPDKVPNRVMCSFTDKAEACDLYNQLWRRRLVAFRNWLD